MWTECIPKTEHNFLFLNCDFGPTTLGPIPEWGSALRLYAAMVFADSRGACVYWGPDRIAFYNEKFAVFCEGAHPFLMGKGFKEAFPTLWDGMSPVFTQAATTGQTVDIDNILLFPTRNGYLEETYFIGQFIPLRGDSGEVEGFYNTTFESTALVLQHRRRAVVHRIAAIVPQDVDKTLSLIMKALGDNPYDITMAMVYSYDEIAADGDANLQLRESIGVPRDHKMAPGTACLRTEQVGLLPVFRKAMLSDRPHVISSSDAEGMFDGISWCGYGEPSREMVVLSLRNGGSMLGFYVQGINPRRSFDDDYKQSVTDMARQIEGKWSSSISFQQAELREQALNRRATDSENRLRHMAKCAPVGMAQVGLDRKIKWANDQYYEITGHDRSNPDVDAFKALINLDEVFKVEEALASILKGQSRDVREYRMKREWSPPMKDAEETEKTHAWILASSYPLIEDGEVKLVMGYVIDISHQKWAEGVQRRNASMAMLAKRRQEEFIDTTSHEMRNPLSAITQLADGIARSLPEDHSPDLKACRDIIADNVESARTILTCAAHQKRIVDDVLILSRLESHMLSITPVVEQISKVIAGTIKMFDGEVAEHRTKIEVTRNLTSPNLAVDYIWVDKLRFMQVLINLVSNAVKFSSSKAAREIIVTYGVQEGRPPSIKTIYGNLEWKAFSNPDDFSAALPDLDAGKSEEPLYLYATVQDTGAGIQVEELERLFKRFSQANSKTHIAYGGSGLGLYICRELTEKQGGGVGVASRSGEGSCFGFYIETRAASPPQALPTRPKSPALRTADQTSEHEGVKVEHEVAMAPNSTTPDSLPRSTTPSESLRPLRIFPAASTRPQRRVLLVEDNLVNQKVLAKQLSKANCLVAIANHGEEALQILADAGHWRDKADFPTPASNTLQTIESPTAEPIVVVLMDWEMPVMNGLECCKEIRRREKSFDPQGPRLPVIATTANVRQEQKDEAFAAGMDDLVEKPFTIGALLEKMDAVLAHKADDG